MRELVAMAAAGAVLGIAAVSSTPSHAAAGRSGTTSVGTTSPLWHAEQRRHHHRGATWRRRGAPYGCYRWGETGYHWYNFCLGPEWLYPHHRVCRHGYCSYR